jgi:DNA-binding NarL/FixJ family response regulator
MKTIRVLICEDNTDKREYLKSLLNGYQGVEVVGALSDGRQAVDRAPLLTPDVVIMDIEMPGLSGIEATAQLKARLPATQIIMYTVYEDEQKLFNSLRAGASGYVLKKAPPQLLLNTINDVVEHGGSVIMPEIARKIIDYFHTTQPRQHSLDERQLIILRLLAKGETIKAIAAQIHLSPDSVKKQLKKIYDALQVSCGKEAVAKAIREGLA